MKLFLTRQCISFTGSLGSGFGYHIQHRKHGFFGKRNSRGFVPPDGHWRFIVACAQLAKDGFHISDIRVTKDEVFQALREAGKGDYFWALHYPNDVLHADDIMNLKKRFGL